jgi:hypothetical protein
MVFSSSVVSRGLPVLALLTITQHMLIIRTAQPGIKGCPCTACILSHRYNGAKEAGALRLEGKEYIVQEVRVLEVC